MTLCSTDDDLFRIMRQELFTCVVGDVMDKLHLVHQFLPPQIHPLRQDMVVAGRAMPVLSADVFEERVAGTANKLMDKPFGLMLEALDDLHKNEIYVNTGSSPRNALWGELMSIRGRKLGSAGAVLNGYTRDTKAILNLDFPTFSWGSYGQDSAPRFKVVDFRVPVEIGMARVRPGDSLFGDIDGVCLVPTEAAEEVFSKALEKVEEKNWSGRRSKQAAVQWLHSRNTALCRSPRGGAQTWSLPLSECLARIEGNVLVTETGDVLSAF